MCTIEQYYPLSKGKSVDSMLAGSNILQTLNISRSVY